MIFFIWWLMWYFWRINQNMFFLSYFNVFIVSCSINKQLDAHFAPRNRILFRYSPMAGGLTSSCLQQREATGYPYMFHDPLHSLSSSYNSRAAVCNPAVAHTQPTTHPSYASGGSTGGPPVSTGTGKFRFILYYSKIILW